MIKVIIQVMYDIITDYLLVSFIQYIYTPNPITRPFIKIKECKKIFFPKLVDQTLQNCKLYLLFEMFKPFSKFHYDIILQTRKEKKFGKLRGRKKL